MHKRNHRVHCAIHQEEKSPLVQCSADRHVLLDLQVSQTTRTYRLIEEIGDSVAGIAVVVVNLRLNA